MRRVEFDGWPQPVSALGFGCASLGSRISRKDGSAAIERALAAGITWFDVAPSYGDGEAESILGEALRGTNVAIVTKVGLRVEASGGFVKALRSFARPIVAAVPGLRAMAKSARAGSIARVPLDGNTIRDSVARSLERLQVDRVAVLALHDPADDDLQRDEVLRALEDVKRQGLAARIGIAGSYANFVAANSASRAVDVAQFAASPGVQYSTRVGALRARDAFVVTHSVFAARAEVARATKADSTTVLRYCFSANPTGVILTSSFAPEHLRANAVTANETPDAGLAAMVESALRSERGGG